MLTGLEVHVGTPIEKCRETNAWLLKTSDKHAGYAEDVFDNLVYRYEEPNGMTRWDSPLFTVPFDDEAPPSKDIWEAMVGSDGRTKIVKPNLATVMVSVNAKCLLIQTMILIPVPETNPRIGLSLRA